MSKQHPPAGAGPTLLTGAEIVWATLEGEGVREVFGYPGGAILPIYDALRKFPIRHVLVRHEQGAAHMADGYARASGRVGVCMATSGPGATNLVTGIATAMLDSGAHRRHHRTGLLQGARLRCLSGSRHHRHHSADHKTQLPRHARGRHRSCNPAGFPDRHLRPSRPCAHRHHQGCSAGDSTLRLRCLRAMRRAPASHAARGIQCDPRSSRADSIGKAARHPRWPRHHAIRGGAAGDRSLRSRSRFPSPPRCSASAASPRRIRCTWA